MNQHLHSTFVEDCFRCHLSRDEALDAECVFCSDEIEQRTVAEAKTMLAVRDIFPVSEGHTLIISRRHVADYFDLTNNERQDLLTLIDIAHRDQFRDESIHGWNIGMNCGEAAGQTVMHFHAHLIPRRIGDTPNPRGGVRGVIPERMSY